MVVSPWPLDGAPQAPQRASLSSWTSLPRVEPSSCSPTADLSSSSLPPAAPLRDWRWSGVPMMSRWTFPVHPATSSDSLLNPHLAPNMTQLCLTSALTDVGCLEEPPVPVREPWQGYLAAFSCTHGELFRPGCHRSAPNTCCAPDRLGFPLMHHLRESSSQPTRLTQTQRLRQGNGGGGPVESMAAKGF